MRDLARVQCVHSRLPGCTAMVKMLRPVCRRVQWLGAQRCVFTVLTTIDPRFPLSPFHVHSTAYLRRQCLSCKALTHLNTFFFCFDVLPRLRKVLAWQPRLGGNGGKQRMLLLATVPGLADTYG